MKKTIFPAILLILTLALGGCHHHKQPIDVDEGTASGEPPPAGEPGPGTPEEPSQPAPTPAPAPRPQMPAPPLKPRATSPGDPASLKMVQQGVKQLNAGDLDSAEATFEQALRISPSYNKPYYYLGVLSFKRKDYKRALAFLEQAETYSYGDNFWLSQVLLHEGLCLKALNLNATAKQKFQLALQKDPTNDWAAQELKKLGQ